MSYLGMASGLESRPKRVKRFDVLDFALREGI